MIWIQYPQERCDAELVRKMIALENTAWPGSGAEEEYPSAPDTFVTAFVLAEQDAVICHVGVRKSILLHKGRTYLAYGLSEVVTHPRWQNRGLASETIKKAAQFIIAQHADISIFTCEKNRVPLYTRGGWEEVKGACLVGGTREKPFRSDSLNLVTMMRFLSSDAKRHKADFENTDIILELGENQLW